MRIAGPVLLATLVLLPAPRASAGDPVPLEEGLRRAASLEAAVRRNEEPDDVLIRGIAATREAYEAHVRGRGGAEPPPPASEEERRGRDRLARERPELWLRIDDRRLQSGELAALVRQSDVVLAPYQRFVGSSGVLLWAALNGKPVLAQDYGLVGRLTREHRLGVSVDAGTPSAIAREITRMVSEGPARSFDRHAAERFATAQTPTRFASLVLSV